MPFLAANFSNALNACLELWEGEVAQTVVLLHHLSLVVNGSKGGVLILSNWWQWVKVGGPWRIGLLGAVVSSSGEETYDVQIVLLSSFISFSINFFFLPQ